VLVAHSYSGAPAEVAAARIPGLLARIVHLDSFAVASGESVADVFPPSMLEAMRAQAAETGNGWQVDPLPPAAMGLERPDDIAFVVPRLTRQSLGTIVERVHIDSGGETVPRTYVECLIGAEMKPFGFYAARARDRGWDYRSLNAWPRRHGHRTGGTGPAPAGDRGIRAHHAGSVNGCRSGNGGVWSRVTAGGSYAEPVEVVVPAVAVQVDGRQGKAGVYQSQQGAVLAVGFQGDVDGTGTRWYR
jgi:hypothetical protein